jgi:DNA topoisomerase-1
MESAKIEHTGPVAMAVGLRYVTDKDPGFCRRRYGKGFVYFDTAGRILRDEGHIARIKSLAIPPAWSDVWISPYSNSHLQVTGRDSKGRKQYRYHPHWSQTCNQTKFDRMLAFADALPIIRAQVNQDLSRPGLPREKVLATIVRLLETTLIRVGNEEYAKTNKSFGLTTMRDRHVKVDGATVRFSFKGKSGLKHTIDLRDRRLAGIVKRCQELPGQELFQYLDENGELRDVSSEDVNQYLREVTQQDFSAKDFRTWAGTLCMIAAMEEATSERDSAARSKSQLIQAVKQVAKSLGNTPAVCRKYYIHPAVIEAYGHGTFHYALLRTDDTGDYRAGGFHPEEIAVVRFLKSLAEVASVTI